MNRQIKAIPKETRKKLYRSIARSMGFKCGE
jgi:hypothetical protein